ncbi:protein FANTASTIC FOUR 3 [Carica papaya]|uniref:protein FANTASTIC FOUR 3 n=1 Tax=Carica papaya TaxID=3649 RepID=UPI000B8CE8C2|nr:protein FANTASTIC FOUR 3 [Carica papaya]
MSEKSLEMCTENLGNETGSEETMSECWTMEKTKTIPIREKSKRLGQSKTLPSFPPPLTTIRGPECLRIRAHREDGRLLIKAIASPVKHSCFQAQRSDGRLRLSLFKISEMEGEFQCENCREEAEEEEGEEEGEEEKYRREHGRCREGLLNLESFRVAAS